jgi:hypothetical protein
VQAPGAEEPHAEDLDALPTCMACRKVDPQPDMTCHQGRDHIVGPRSGCPACGRLLAVIGIGNEPRPPESFAYGSPDLRHMRAGRYRVFYTIDEEQRVIQIDHVGCLP